MSPAPRHSPTPDEATGLELPPRCGTPAHRRGTARDPRLLVAVLAGGAVGTLARTGLEELVPHGDAAWPWATFAANVVGAFLLGVVATYALERRADRTYARPLLGTGLCGGLTTFSTMQLELLRMLDADAVGLALGYAAASVVVGLAAVVAGTRLVRSRRDRPPGAGAPDATAEGAA